MSSGREDFLSVCSIASERTSFMPIPPQQVPTGGRPSVLYRALGVTPKDITDKLTTGLTITERVTEPLFYVPASVTVTMTLSCSVYGDFTTPDPVPVPREL